MTEAAPIGGLFVSCNHPKASQHAGSPMSSNVKDVKGTVSCKSCGKMIVINAEPRTLTEFSVKCEHCGKRSFYTARDIDLPSRR